eukprot:5489978-Amphidinium_carterae.1
MEKFGETIEQWEREAWRATSRCPTRTGSSGRSVDPDAATQEAASADRGQRLEGELRLVKPEVRETARLRCSSLTGSRAERCTNEYLYESARNARSGCTRTKVTIPDPTTGHDWCVERSRKPNAQGSNSRRRSFSARCRPWSWSFGTSAELISTETLRVTCTCSCHLRMSSTRPTLSRCAAFCLEACTARKMLHRSGRTTTPNCVEESSGDKVSPMEPCSTTRSAKLER